MVQRASAEQNVDELRFYATGLSMGGGGTWNLINRHGDHFAAAALPSALVLPATGYLPSNLTEVPTWAFHAANDGTVSPTTTRSVITSMLATTGEAPPTFPSRPTADLAFQSTTLDLRSTEYRTGGHGIWGRVYNTPAFYDWMFAHALVPEPSSLAIVLVTGLGVDCSAGRRSAARRRST